MLTTNKQLGIAGGCARYCLRRRSAALAILLSVMLAHTGAVWAVPVFGLQVSVLIDESQPESPANVTTVFVWGDEYKRIMQDVNGFALIRDQTAGSATLHQLCYAQLSADGTQLLPSGTKFGSVDPATIQGLAKNLHQNLSSLAMFQVVPALRMAREIELRSPPAGPTTGVRRGLCILINFPEKQSTITKAQITSYCNQDATQGSRYSDFGNNGSVYDFFYESSNGQLKFTHVVYDYYMAQNPRSYYDNQNKSSSGAQQLIMEALKGVASQQGIDFSQVDTEVGSDGRTYVKYISVKYAGDMPADNGYPLWPNRWAINSASPAVDGTIAASNGTTYYANLYQISNIGDALAIGTFCHECGHLVCGYVDYYDTTYSSSGLGDFCLMSSGNWNYHGANAQGTNPAPPHPYLRFKSGWLIPKAANSGSTSLSCNLSDVLQVSKPGNPQEYFMISAIQNAGHLADVPAQGLAVFHIDESKNGNTQPQRTASQHYESALMQADAMFALEMNPGSGGNRGDSTDLFSSQNSTVLFTDTSGRVNANWWDGTTSSLSVTQIGASGGSSITFSLGAPVSGQPQTNGNGPTIASGPTASPNPAYAGQEVTFTVNATDPNNLALTIVWDFGDGSTGTGTPAVHNYTASGNYNVKVTVTNTAQAAASAPVAMTVALKALTVSKATFQLNFKSHKDTLDLLFYSSDFKYTARKAFLADTNGSVLSVFIGTTQVDSLTLKNGSGKATGSATWDYKKGQIHYTASRAKLEDVVSTYGATNTPVSNQVALPLQIQVFGLGYGGQYTFKYSVSQGKTGKGQVSAPQTGQ